MACILYTELIRFAGGFNPAGKQRRMPTSGFSNWPAYSRASISAGKRGGTHLPLQARAVAAEFRPDGTTSAKHAGHYLERSIP